MHSTRPTHTLARHGVLLAIALSAWSGVLGGPSSVSAQPVPERRVGVHFVEGVPHLDVSVADFAADAETRRKLASGLPQTLSFDTLATVTGANTPVAASARECRVVYDLWEERYRVQVRSERADRTTTVATVEEVIAQCLVAERLPIGTRRDWVSVRGRSVTFTVRVALNPLTVETVERVRRWLARPQRGQVDSDSFFGSFVGIFVSRGIGAAERALQFRSQEVTVP